MTSSVTPVEIKKWSKFSLATSGSLVQGRQGARRSRKKGVSQEYSGFRYYTPGDDVRQIDWNAYGRTKRYVIKEFYDQVEQHVCLFVDSTRSMTATSEKWLQLQRLTSALSVMTVANTDRLRLVPIPTSSQAPELTRHGNLFFYLKRVEELTSEKGTSFLDAASHWVANHTMSRGLSIILSDCLEEPHSFEGLLSRLQSSRQRVICLQILDPVEVNPSFSGDLRLLDMEGSGAREISFSRKVRERYESAFQLHQQTLKNIAKKSGTAFVTVQTDHAIDDIIYRQLMPQGLVTMG